jgi:hypothetical protein
VRRSCLGLIRAVCRSPGPGRVPSALRTSLRAPWRRSPRDPRSAVQHGCDRQVHRRPPRGGVRLPKITGVRYHIARADQGHARCEGLPERYRAISYIAARCGRRGRESCGSNGRDRLRGPEIHVRHQLMVASERQPFLAPTRTGLRAGELPASAADAFAAAPGSRTSAG